MHHWQTDDKLYLQACVLQIHHKCKPAINKTKHLMGVRIFVKTNKKSSKT